MVAMDGRFGLENFGKSLLISNVTEEDEARYECKFPRDPSLGRQFSLSVEGAFGHSFFAFVLRLLTCYVSMAYVLNNVAAPPN